MTNLNQEDYSGKRFVFKIKKDIAVEWLVVRRHPDDFNLYLVVPGDDFPFVGSIDVDLTGGSNLLAIRCGQACWLPLDFILKYPQVGTVSENALRLVRKNISRLARGEEITPDAVDFDPEYWHWLYDVSQARNQIEKEAYAL